MILRKLVLIPALLIIAGYSSNKEDSINSADIIDSEKFPLILTTFIVNEKDLNDASMTFEKDNTLTWKKNYMSNPNTSDEETVIDKDIEIIYTDIEIVENNDNYTITGNTDGKSETVVLKLIDDNKRLEDAEGNLYGDFGGN